jgi:radical SAM protein with 4Fe4S-binding SPASM domain
MTLAEWKRVVDELAAHNLPGLMLRGGEPFMFPQIIELLEYIHDKGMSISIDTNGTMLERYAGEIARIGGMHLTVSVDGPEAIHDEVRGVKGTFQRLKDGIARVAAAEVETGNRIGRSICFTISRYSYRFLGAMPEVARSLGIGSIAIVPYYYFPDSTGAKYEQELHSLGCKAFSWVGSHHEDSGVDADEFISQFRQYQESLGEVRSYPYMPLNETEYRAWFAGPEIPVGPQHCLNVERLIDIQPDGSANFCVDFVDYSFGNVREARIEQLWNGERAGRFRTYRRRQPLAVCYRCGAKYMSKPWAGYLLPTEQPRRYGPMRVVFGPYKQHRPFFPVTAAVTRETSGLSGSQRSSSRRIASLASPILVSSLPLAWSSLPETSVERSPVTLPTFSLTAPLTSSRLPRMRSSVTF